MPTALLTPPVLLPATDSPNRLAVAAPVTRRLSALLTAPPTAFDVPASGGTPAATLAAHCPDLLLISAPTDHRKAVVSELTTIATRAGQRVLVLTNDPEGVFVALSHDGREVGRAIGTHETEDSCPCAGHTAAARGRRFHEAARVGLKDRVAELQARIAREEAREKLRAEFDAITAELPRLAELLSPEVDASADMVKATADLNAALVAFREHAARLTEAEKELAELKQANDQPAGFFKKLFGGGKPDPAKVEAAEAKVRELTSSSPPDPYTTFNAARETFLAESVAERRLALAGRLAKLESEVATFPPAEPLDELCRAFDDATKDLAHLDEGLLPLPAAELDAVRVVVGPPSAVGHDPFVTPLHPEVEPQFDRIVWTDAEDLNAESFAAAAPLGAAWVFFGSPDPLHAPGYRNGRPRSAFFSGWWHRLHAHPWTQEDGRPLARLLPVENRDELTCEPLYGRPEVEVRWADRDGTPTLAEVLFPTGMSVADAKAFLATEADEVRFTGYGPTDWDTTGEVLRCRWPAVDEAVGVRDEADLGRGVKERTVNGFTAEVQFDVKTWTRDSAADWLTERMLPPPRTAVV